MTSSLDRQTRTAQGGGDGGRSDHALKVGLKVDSDALPPGILEKADLKDPATTVALLKLNAVVGPQGRGACDNHITSLGVTCALCHSTVDDSVQTGIGKRLDGWPNRDLDVGAIIALSPALTAEQKKVYKSWGPGKYDPRFNLDGKNTAARAFRRPMASRSQERDVHGRRSDLVLERLRGGDADGRAGQFHRRAAQDRCRAFAGSGDPQAARAAGVPAEPRSAPPPPRQLRPDGAQRGKVVFNRTCATCHVGGNGTDNDSGKLHAAGGNGHGRRLRHANGEQGVSHDAATRTAAAPAVLPRRQRRRRSRTWWSTTTRS